MMRARGSYRIAECKNLKATAVDLPYDVSGYTDLLSQFQEYMRISISLLILAERAILILGSVAKHT